MLDKSTKTEKERKLITIKQTTKRATKTKTSSISSSFSLTPASVSIFDHFFDCIERDSKCGGVWCESVYYCVLPKNGEKRWNYLKYIEIGVTEESLSSSVLVNILKTKRRGRSKSCPGVEVKGREPR